MGGTLIVYLLFPLFYLAVTLGNLRYFLRFLKRDAEEHPITPVQVAGLIILYVIIAWAPIAVGRFVAVGEPCVDETHKPV